MKLDAAIKKKTDAFSTKYKSGNFPQGVTLQSLENEIKQCKGEITAYEESLSEGNAQNLFTGVAFVSFRTEKMKNDLLKQFKLSKFQRFSLAFEDCFSIAEKGGLFFYNSRLFIKEAAEPGDVYWNCLGLNEKERFVRIIVGRFFSLLLVIGCGALIYYFTITEYEVKNLIILYLLSIGVVVLNKGLSIMTPKIVKSKQNFV